MQLLFKKISLIVFCLFLLLLSYSQVYAVDNVITGNPIKIGSVTSMSFNAVLGNGTAFILATDPPNPNAGIWYGDGIYFCMSGTCRSDANLTGQNRHYELIQTSTQRKIKVDGGDFLTVSLPPVSNDIYLYSYPNTSLTLLNYLISGPPPVSFDPGIKAGLSGAIATFSGSAFSSLVGLIPLALGLLITILLVFKSIHWFIEISNGKKSSMDEIQKSPHSADTIEIKTHEYFPFDNNDETYECYHNFKKSYNAEISFEDYNRMENDLNYDFEKYNR
jgi:hypothetical protein